MKDSQFLLDTNRKNRIHDGSFKSNHKEPVTS